MSWLRKSRLDPLAVAMCGVKLGDRLLVVGASDHGLAAALAAKSGLTGRACIVDASEADTIAAAAAVRREGALAESFTAPWSLLSFEAHTFDVVVVRNVFRELQPDPRLRAAAEVHRVLRPGGRVVVVEDTPRGGVGGFLRRGRIDPSYARSGGATHALEAAGFRGVRTLAEREGYIFVEGIKSGA